MRRHFARSIGALALATLTTTLAAAEVSWTNTAGGNWSQPNNWDPNRSPGAADNVFITASGSYTVTQDVSAAVASLTLGDGSGSITLTNVGTTLSISGASLVSSHAVFGMGGGSLSGDGWLAIDGVAVWVGGQVARTSGLSVGSNGVLEITGTGGKLLYGGLTNSGWVRVTGAGVLGFCAGTVANLGLFELENDEPIYLAGYCGPAFFWNSGVLRKSGGDGTNQFSGVPLVNTGTVEALRGWISFSGGSWFGTGTLFTGTGTNLLDQGNVTFDGTIVSTNAELAGATLFGTNTLRGVTRWTGGGIDHSARVTVAADGKLEITGPAFKSLGGTLRNEGSVRLTGNAALALCAGTLENPGVFELENDQAIYLQGYCGPSLFWNTGLLRKSGGTGTNLFWSVPMANTGTIEAQQGWISFGGGSVFGTGTHFLGAGTNLLDRGNLSFDGTILSSNAELGGAVLFGTNSVRGKLRWTAGDIDHSARVTISEDGQLEISGAARKLLGGTLTNQGLVRLTGEAALGLCAGTVENFGVFELENDQAIYLGGYCGGSLFWNAGLLRKSGGVGTNLFGAVPVGNTGTVDVQKGWISFDNGSWFGSGTAFLGGGTNLLDRGTITFDGTIVSSNMELAGATLFGTNVIRGPMRWTAGGIHSSSRVTVAADGQLEISGAAAKTLAGRLYNEGLVRLTGAAALGLCAGAVENHGVFRLENDQPIFLGGYCGASLFSNVGLVQKSGGVGTNLFSGVPVVNSGTIDAQQGWISFGNGSWFGTGTVFQGAGTNLLDRESLTFDGTIVSTNAELAGAVLFGTNVIRGTMRWTAGNIDHSAMVTVAADGQLEITGATAKTLAGRLYNEGLVRLTGAAALGLCAGTVENHGVFRLENDQSIFLGGYCGASLFSNASLLQKSGGVGTNLFWSVPVLNTGTIEARQGWIGFGNGSWFGTGTVFQGAGTNLLDRGSLTFDGAITSTNAELAGATLFGTNVIRGTMRWTDGGIDHSARVTIPAGGTLEISGPAAKVLGGTLNNEGLVRLTGAAALALCAGTVENRSVFELENDQPIYLGGYCGASVFWNAGLLRKSVGTGTNVFSSVPLANTGTVEVRSGTVAFDGGFKQTAGRTRLAGGSVSSSRALEFEGGVLCGSGDVFGNVNNQAELNPGQTFGVLTIHGNYTHGGRANFEIGGLAPGTSYDRLNVTGTASLSGAMNFSLAPGYRPQGGDVFQVMTFGARTGPGPKFGGLDLGGGKYFTPVFGPADLTLLTTSGPTNLYQMVLVPCAESTYELRFTCLPDEFYTVEASSQLTNDWVVVCTTNAPVGVLDYIDIDAPNYPQRFYRVRAGK